MGGVERMRHIGGAAVAVKTPMARQALPPAERHSYAAREVDNELRILHLCAPNPNVIHAFGAFGLAEDWPRFIMEAADTDLSKRIESRVAWSTFELEQIALGVACGLERVHLVGVIHCDIKPQNVLLVGNVAKVADFGVACYRRPSEPGDETRTQPAPFPWLHDTGGTCTWFSPERAEAFWMLPESSNLSVCLTRRMCGRSVAFFRPWLTCRRRLAGFACQGRSMTLTTCTRGSRRKSVRSGARRHLTRSKMSQSPPQIETQGQGPLWRRCVAPLLANFNCR